MSLRTHVILLAIAFPSVASAGPILDEEESICGVDDLQRVNSYDGTLGVSRQFVQKHKYAVGALADRRQTPFRAYCSGTLISRDLFLTAGHCVDNTTANDFVVFDYETAVDGSMMTSVQYTVNEVVERTHSGQLDYAILRLDGNPGDDYGWTDVRDGTEQEGMPISIIQHPSGDPKMIEAGRIDDINGITMRYADLDTEGGSSGSAVLNSRGEIIGVHIQGYCNSNDGYNLAVRMSELVDRSRTLRALANPQRPVVRRNAGKRLGQGYGLDLAWNCRDEWGMGASAHTVGNGAYDWRCETDIGDKSFSMSTACKNHYGPNAISRLEPSGRATDWYCALGVSILTYCKTAYGSSARATTVNDDYSGWRCEVNGRLYGVEVRTACRQQYKAPNAKAVLYDQTLNGWRCEL